MTHNDYSRLLRRIQELQVRKERVIVAIDGRCGSGKTTLAARLQKDLDCRVFHMDDFFLRPQQRTAERFAQPGENVDHERFLEEVLLPLRSGQPVTYRPFSCAQQQLGAPVTAAPCRLAIVEGAYACHPRPVGVLRPAGVPDRRPGNADAAHRSPQWGGKGRAVPRPLDPL